MGNATQLYSEGLMREVEIYMSSLLQLKYNKAFHPLLIKIHKTERQVHTI